jgi:hypothetical protein
MRFLPLSGTGVGAGWGLVVPILWVGQHDQTIRRLTHLRDQLETIPPAEALVFDKDISYGTHGRRSA